MWGQTASGHLVGDVRSCAVIARSVWSTAISGCRLGGLLVSFKLLWWLADISFVQRSALITGLSLALTGLTLVGVSEWATGGFDSGADHASATLSPSSFTRNRVLAPDSLPELPDTSDHMPANVPGYSFRHEVPEVRLQFTVADERGRLISDLSSTDVRVFDNQSQVGHFNEFERDDDLPLQLGLVIDTSDSVRRVLPQEKAAAIEFLRRVMRPETDTASVAAFGGEIKIWQRSTADLPQLLNAVSRVQEPGWGTREFDALYAACIAEAQLKTDGKSVHRAIIVLSDGDDTDSLHSLQDVIAAAQRNEIQIDALTIHPKKVADRGDRILQQLAESTGGRMFVAASVKELGSAFAEIEQDLRTQYYVSFPPQQPTPGFHSLRVEVNAPRKLEVHARQGYYALQQ